MPPKRPRARKVNATDPSAEKMDTSVPNLVSPKQTMTRNFTMFGWDSIHTFQRPAIPFAEILKGMEWAPQPPKPSSSVLDDTSNFVSAEAICTDIAVKRELLDVDTTDWFHKHKMEEETEREGERKVASTTAAQAHTPPAAPRHEPILGTSPAASLVPDKVKPEPWEGTIGQSTARYLQPSHRKDLFDLWQADPRVPTMASRRAWAEAHGLPERVVSSWYHRQARKQKRVAGVSSAPEPIAIKDENPDDGLALAQKSHDLSAMPRSVTSGHGCSAAPSSPCPSLTRSHTPPSSSPRAYTPQFPEFPFITITQSSPIPDPPGTPLPLDLTYLRPPKNKGKKKKKKKRASAEAHVTPDVEFFEASADASRYSWSERRSPKLDEDLPCDRDSGQPSAADSASRHSERKDEKTKAKVPKKRERCNRSDVELENMYVLTSAVGDTTGTTALSDSTNLEPREIYSGPLHNICSLDPDDVFACILCRGQRTQKRKLEEENSTFDPWSPPFYPEDGWARIRITDDSLMELSGIPYLALTEPQAPDVPPPPVEPSKSRTINGSSIIKTDPSRTIVYPVELINQDCPPGVSLLSILESEPRTSVAPDPVPPLLTRTAPPPFKPPLGHLASPWSTFHPANLSNQDVSPPTSSLPADPTSLTLASSHNITTRKTGLQGRTTPIHPLPQTNEQYALFPAHIVAASSPTPLSSSSSMVSSTSTQVTLITIPFFTRSPDFSLTDPLAPYTLGDAALLDENSYVGRVARLDSDAPASAPDALRTDGLPSSNTLDLDLDAVGAGWDEELRAFIAESNKELQALSEEIHNVPWYPGAKKSVV